MRRDSLLRRVWHDGSLPTGIIEALSHGDLDDLLFRSAPLQVKDRCLVGRFEDDRGSFLIKRHVWGGPGRTLRMAFREPAARGCARHGQFLNSHGVRTPCPRGAVEYRLGPWTRRSYLLTDYIEGESLYRQIRAGIHAPRELTQLAIQVADIWQQLVSLGASHNDFKPENFIVDQELRVWLIDLEKMRIDGNASKQRARHIFDAKNFLHIRGWHRRPEARALFAEQLLNTASGGCLQGTGIERVAKGLSLCDTERDADLSAWVVSTENMDLAALRQALDSLRDIADEAFLLEPTESGPYRVRERVAIFAESGANSTSNKPTTRPNPLAHSSNGNGTSRTALSTTSAENHWRLVIHQNEIVTPFLSKVLQQRITNTESPDSFRISVARQYLGQTFPALGKQAPIRLIRDNIAPHESLQSACEDPCVANEGTRCETLAGCLQACCVSSLEELLERMNETTTRSAELRLRAGERSSLVRGLWRAAWRGLAAGLGADGFRNGWVGFQLAALRAASAWVEEAKLHQLTTNFHPPKAGDAHAESKELRDSATQDSSNRRRASRRAA